MHGIRLGAVVATGLVTASCVIAPSSNYCLAGKLALFDGGQAHSSESRRNHATWFRRQVSKR